MISVKLVQHWGSDELVAKMAKASYGKFNDDIGETDTSRIIAALSRKDHFTPFAHQGATFEITAPIYVARQLGRHQVGFAWSEISRRYTKKDIHIDQLEYFPTLKAAKLWENAVDLCLSTYEQLLEEGYLKEEARGILPQSMETTWFWSGSLAAWLRLIYQRDGNDVQKKTRKLVLLIKEELQQIFPISIQNVKSRQ
jgi:thymidylate synthase (FAD)